MNLALFDFDGTITRKDSFLDFLRFSFPLFSLVKAYLALIFWLLGYKLGFVSNNKAKEIVFSWFFKGCKAKKFKEMGERFALQKLPDLVKKSAEIKINEHLTNGDKVVVVTASIEQYIKPWTDKLGIDIIATKPEIKNNLLTGGFKGENCYGKQKVIRIKEMLDIEQYDVIFAYGDSAGDKEMLSIAHHPFYKYFK